MFAGSTDAKDGRGLVGHDLADEDKSASENSSE